MESAALVLATLAVVIILQIITIALVTRKKPSRSQSGPRPNYIQPGERNEKREYDNRRNNKRTFQDNRTRQPQQPQKEPSSIDPVEKSLRDINLKLKNAERDQEQARRKVQEFTKDNNGSNNRSENGNRSDRHDRGSRRNNRDRRDNRDQRRGNYQERQNREAPRASENPAAPVAEVTEPVAVEQNVPVITEPTVENTAPATTPELVANDVGVSDDNLQHGRRFAVKRRQLKSEDGSESTASVESEEPNKNEMETEMEARPAAEEIRFGRR